MPYLPPDLAELPRKASEWTEKHVKTWLWHGFTRRNLARDEAPQFYPLSELFSFRESPESEIADICAQSVGFRARMVPAISSLFGDVPPTATGLKVFHHLQNLAIALHEPSLLEPMWTRLASPGFLDRALPEEKEELFARSFLSVEKLSSSSEAQNILRTRMLGSRFFNPDWTPSVLAAIMKNDPSQLGIALRLISPFVDAISEDSRIRFIVDRSKATLAEAFLSFGDQTKVVDGLLDDHVIELAELPEKSTITAILAGEILHERLSVDVEDAPVTAAESSFSPTIVKIDLTSMLEPLEKTWYRNRAAPLQMIQASFADIDFRLEKAIHNQRRRNQRHEQSWMQERTPAYA